MSVTSLALIPSFLVQNLLVFFLTLTPPSGGGASLLDHAHSPVVLAFASVLG